MKKGRRTEKRPSTFRYMRYVRSVLELSDAPNQPDEDVTGKYRSEGEGDSDSQEVFGVYGFAVLAENTDSGDICRGSDGGEVAAESSAGEQSEVENIGLNTRAAVHHCSDTLNNGEHGGNIGDIVNKCRENNGSENNKSIQQEGVVACNAVEKTCDGIDNAGSLNAFDDHEKTEEKQESVLVKILDNLLEGLGVMLLNTCASNTDYAHYYADKTASVIVKSKHGPFGGFGNKGGNDKKHNGSNQHYSGEEIFNYGFNLCGNGLLIFMEKNQQDNNGSECTKFNAPENTGFAVHPEELHEVHVGKAAQQYTGGIAYKSGSPLQVGRNSDGNKNGNGGNLELLGDCQTDGGNHKNGCNVINKCTDDTGKKCKNCYRPFYVGNLGDKQLGQSGGHLAFDKQGYKTHCTTYHKQNIVVNGGKCGKYIDVKDSAVAENYEYNSRRKGYVRTPLLERKHQNIRNQKDYESKYHSEKILQSL